jgi:Bacterial low temperature requirement A protein (LtrA)
LVEVHLETRRARHRTPVADERPVDVHQPVVERQVHEVERALQQVAQLVRPGTEAHSEQGQDHDALNGQAQIRIGVDHCASLDSSAGTVTAFVAFAGSLALWWIYFDRGAQLASDVIAASDDPGRLGRSAYAYFHVPMVAGIIVPAIADELTIADAGGDVTAGTAAVIFGGPALYLGATPCSSGRCSHPGRGYGP